MIHRVKILIISLRLEMLFGDFPFRSRMSMFFLLFRLFRFFNEFRCMIGLFFRFRWWYKIGGGFFSF